MPAPARDSPSPPPLPPVALTPGPRASKFFTLFSSALTKTLSTVSLSKFGACFPTAAAQAPRILASVHAQIVQGVETRATAEFEDICREREVVAGLNELERLVAEAKGRRERGEGGGGMGDAPHTLPPTTLYLAHLAPYLASTHTQLMAQLAETQAENEALARRIDAQRKEADGLLQGLERVVRDLEVANGVLGEHVGEVERDGGAEERAELGGR